MNGPEHYREAERLLDLVDSGDAGGHDRLFVSMAQVYAELAKVAAIVGVLPTDDWREVLS